MADTFKIIKCPACQKKMHKIFIPQHGINLDICLDGCGGIYFDNREFKYFDEQHENIDRITEVLKDKTFIKVDESLPRVCPVCGAKMVKNFSSIKREIQIDDCYSCGGKFLDNGELIKFREEYKTQEDRSSAMLDFVYSTVGAELKESARKNALANKKRSPLKKLFDYLVYGN